MSTSLSADQRRLLERMENGHLLVRNRKSGQWTIGNDPCPGQIALNLFAKGLIDYAGLTYIVTKAGHDALAGAGA